MKRSTSLLLLLVFCVLPLISSTEGGAATLQEVKQRGKLIAGVKTDFPPLEFLDGKGVLKGFNIDIAGALAKDFFGSEKAIEFVRVTPENQIVFLTSGKVDAIVAMGVTGEREKKIDFSTPYFISGQCILVRGNSQITKYQDLAGKQVATLPGSMGDSAIAELVPTAQRIRFERPSEAVNAVTSRRVEAYVGDFISLYNLANRTRGVRIASLEPFSPAPFSVAVNEGNKELLDAINAALEKMKKTGEYENLLKKWFGAQATVLWRLFQK